MEVVVGIVVTMMMSLQRLCGLILPVPIAE